MKQSATARNIYAIRNHYGYNQTDFGKKVGVSQVTVSKWETSGHDISEENIAKILAAFPVSYDDIRSEANGFAKRVNRPTGGETPVPLFGRIAAGDPIEMDAAEDAFNVPTRVHAAHPDAFLLKVDGESMNRILPNGCYALVDPCDDIERDGEPYAVCVNGYDATVKRVRKLNNGFELVPDSTDPTFAVHTYNYNEPGTDEITVIGRVVYYVLPYDWSF